VNDVKTTHDDLIDAAHRAHAGENINRSGGQMAREVAETDIPAVADPDAARQRRSPRNRRRLVADNARWCAPVEGSTLLATPRRVGGTVHPIHARKGSTRLGVMAADGPRNSPSYPKGSTLYLM